MITEQQTIADAPEPVTPPVVPTPEPVQEPKPQPIDPSIAAKKAELQQKIEAVDTYKMAMQVQTTFMSPNVWTQIRSMSKVFFESKALPAYIHNEAQLVMVMQAGFEIGMKPVESLHSLYMVNGLTTIWGKAIVKRLREHGWKIKYLDETETSCSAIVSKGDEEYSETYTYDMAEKSGYTKSRAGEFKIGWLPGINRKLKLRYGVLSLIIKSYIPEVLGSVDDIQEVAEDFVLLNEEQPKPKAKEKDEVIVGDVATPIPNTTLAERLTESRVSKEQKPVQSKEEVKK